MVFGRKARTVAGLDIGASSIKLVKLEERSGGWALAALGMREIPMETVVDEEIKDRETVIFNVQSLIDQCDPKLKDVAISISGHGVITDKITIDQKSGAEAEQAILFEAEQRSPFDHGLSRYSGQPGNAKNGRPFGGSQERNLEFLCGSDLRCRVEAGDRGHRCPGHVERLPAQLRNRSQ